MLIRIQVFKLTTGMQLCKIVRSCLLKLRRGFLSLSRSHSLLIIKTIVVASHNNNKLIMSGRGKGGKGLGKGGAKRHRKVLRDNIHIQSFTEHSSNVIDIPPIRTYDSSNTNEFGRSTPSKPVAPFTASAPTTPSTVGETPPPHSPSSNSVSSPNSHTLFPMSTYESPLLAAASANRNSRPISTTTAATREENESIRDNMGGMRSTPSPHIMTTPHSQLPSTPRTTRQTAIRAAALREQPCSAIAQTTKESLPNWDTDMLHNINCGGTCVGLSDDAIREASNFTKIQFRCSGQGGEAEMVSGDELTFDAASDDDATKKMNGYCDLSPSSIPSAIGGIDDGNDDEDNNNDDQGKQVWQNDIWSDVSAHSSSTAQYDIFRQKAASNLVSLLSPNCMIEAGLMAPEINSCEEDDAAKDVRGDSPWDEKAGSLKKHFTFDADHDSRGGEWKGVVQVNRTLFRDDLDDVVKAKILERETPPTGHRQDPARLTVSMTTSCCAECDADGGASLKACITCRLVKYCNAKCQHKHWPKHKKTCKQRATELRDEVLFKDPPPKEDCSICFLPMPILLISCATLPPATILSVPIYDFAIANEELATEPMETYYPCCGKSICKGCVHSFCESGNDAKCPFCNSNRGGKTDEESVEEVMKRVEANDAGAIWTLAGVYYNGFNGLQQDRTKAIELYTKAAELGCSKAHHYLGFINRDEGDLKKAKFHWEAAAMAGCEDARCNLGNMEGNSGNIERAVKHWNIAASAGGYMAMHHLITCFKKGAVSRESIDSTLVTYNSSCAEMRSEARDAAKSKYRSTTIA